ncbi:S1 RNA-binding domain-containing protein [Streptomyces tanashiensis]|uniref:S1 RNA-binding domain-containing protein n=1 Tax=Streptomyces tanashiensis TaxID=67367 RepID=UPI0033F5DACE
MDWQSECPELWAFLGSLRHGDVLSGTVATIERFGVFVALDDGPDHPLFPGVGFITFPELSWRYFEAPTDVVAVGQRVEGLFLQFDTYNAEARLSLKGLQPDPFQAFADRAVVGQTVWGTVRRVTSFAVFIEVGDGCIGAMVSGEPDGPSASPPPRVFRVGDAVSVVIAGIDRSQRGIALSWPQKTRRPGLAQGGE